ncbi:hypothetical protein [Aliikangiella maris]|uniref:Uncharacterized protein n=2 Tax=Aliikangiella maris TaxID=3162458 RepID=A0ABV2BZC1_9GAMM
MLILGYLKQEKLPEKIAPYLKEGEKRLENKLIHMQYQSNQLLNKVKECSSQLIPN